MATYAIGDVQGCYAELMEMLEKVSFNPAEDRLWFAGDLVNRGPESLKTLTFIESLSNKVVITLGNHDMHLLAVAHGDQKFRPHDTFQDVLKAPNCNDLLYWLRHQKVLHYDKSLNFVLVHAGIYPLWALEQAQQLSAELETMLRSDKHIDFFAHMYGNEPTIWRDDLAGWDRYRFITNVFARMRYCDANGRLNLTEKGVLGEQPATLMPWYDVPRRKPIFPNIVFGHWAALNGQPGKANIFAVDTGCSWGHELTALRLEDKQVFQVKSTGSGIQDPRRPR